MTSLNTLIEAQPPAPTGTAKRPVLRVCIIGLKCFDYIAGAPSPRYLGGIETQLTLLAKGLSQEGCAVSLITFDHNQPDQQVFEGVTVFKAYPPTGGLPGLRFFQRALALRRAMRRANADIYVQMGAGSETGVSAAGCPRGSRFVYCIASDGDYGPYLQAGRLGWEGKVYHYGLRQADLILAQTLRQQDGLRTATGLESRVIPMAAAAPISSAGNNSRRSDKPRVLWVGRVMPEKRMEWLLKMARDCPEFCFDIVGAPNRNSEYATSLVAEAGKLSNVKVHGRVSAAELGNLYAQAHALCCTSIFEGFPTTFLEAWSCGLPVITTFDPDGIVARRGLGLVAETADELTAHLRRSLSDRELYSRLSDTARRYHTENHTIQAVSRHFRAVFEDLAASN